MNRTIGILACIIILTSCTSNETRPEAATPTAPAILGTWKLLTGTTIRGTDTTVVDYTRGQEMIKIITPTHFSFTRHDLNHGKDSLAVFSAGAGRVKFNDSTYTELLDFFNVREWEGGQFELHYKINGDTLVTTGVERVEKLGVDQLNIEKYVRVK